MPTVLAIVSLSLALGGVPQQPPDAPNASYYFLLGRHLEGNGKIDDAVAAITFSAGYFSSCRSR